MDSQGGCYFGASDHQWGTFATKIYIIYVCTVQTKPSTVHMSSMQCNYCLSASLCRRIRRRSNRSDLVNSISVQS